jgi:hypothetical protein
MITRGFGGLRKTENDHVSVVSCFSADAADHIGGLFPDFKNPQTRSFEGTHFISVRSRILVRSKGNTKRDEKFMYLEQADDDEEVLY